MKKQSFILKKLSFFIFVFLFARQLYSQVLLAPKYTVQKTKNGFIYTFSVNPQELVHYRVFDSFTGTVTEGEAFDADKLSVNHNDTVTAWTETFGGTRSRIVTLSREISSTIPKINVLSPAEGTWANRQALVIDVANDSEVFYSFSGTNPLEFGFAYDGPVLIDISGDVEVKIAAVHSSGEVIEKTIKYSVKEAKGKKAPLDISSMEPIISIGVDSVVNLPEDTTFVIGDNVHPYLKGQTLSPLVPSCRNNCVPLLINSNNAFYRYMLQSIDAPSTGSIQQLALTSPIQIIDWNFVMLRNENTVQYSVDNGSWQLYTEPFYIDRTQQHKITWKENSKIQTVDLPPKPVLIGLPENNITNTSLEIQCSNPLYTFRLENQGEVSRPLTSYYIDALYGEEKIVSVSLPIYYGNIRQGELSFSVKIDRQPPAAPLLINSENGYWFRTDIGLNLYSPDSIYTAVQETYKSAQFYENFNTTENISIPDDLDFVPFAGTKMLLTGDESFAVNYTVYAYSKDAAGNKSDISVFRAIVDRNNYYLDSASRSKIPDGSPQNPFTTVEEAFGAVNSLEKSILHVKGYFPDLQSVQLLTDCTITGYDNCRFSFLRDGVFKIKNCNVVIENCLFEKNGLIFGEEANYTSLSEQPIIQTHNAQLSLNNCELIFTGVKSAQAIYGDNSKLNLSRSNITVVASNYASAVSALKSEIIGTDSRFLLTAENTVGFSLTDSLFSLKKSYCLLNTKRGRGAELYNCIYAMEDNTCELTGPTHTILSNLQIWKDAASFEAVSVTK